MILKSGEQGNWNYIELSSKVNTKLKDNGHYAVTVSDDNDIPLKTYECQGPECYLMNNNGKTIENLSPIKESDCIRTSKPYYSSSVSGNGNVSTLDINQDGTIQASCVNIKLNGEELAKKISEHQKHSSKPSFS